MSILKEIEPLKTRDFLKEKFADYYSSANIIFPPKFTSREWGFLQWEGGGMYRHISFRSVTEAKQYLEKKKEYFH